MFPVFMKVLLQASVSVKGAKGSTAGDFLDSNHPPESIKRKHQIRFYFDSHQRIITLKPTTEHSDSLILNGSPVKINISFLPDSVRLQTEME